MSEHVGMRMTRQRQVIIEELAKVTSHPTADELYDSVRRRLPRISLGTIYRNLDILSETGKILRICVGGTQRRYDAAVHPHYHVCCERCGCVDDVEITSAKKLERSASRECGYQISSHWVVFQGVCPACQGQTAAQA